MQEMLQSTDSEAACLIALQRRESGAWLQIIPSQIIGTLMDDTTFTTCML